MGDFLLAKKHFEIATSLYDRERHHQLTLRYSGVDLGIGARSYLALTLWNLQAKYDRAPIPRSTPLYLKVSP